MTPNGLRQPDDHAIFENLFLGEWHGRFSLDHFSRASMLSGLPQTIFTSKVIKWEPEGWKINDPLTIQLISYPQTRDIQITLMGKCQNKETWMWEDTPFILRHFYSINSYHTLREFRIWADEFLLKTWPILKSQIHGNEK